MMKTFRLLLIFLIVTACSGDDNGNDCSRLLDVNVNFTINLNLPQFNQLNFTSGVVYVSNQGNGGIYLIRTNPQTILAWDGADPNFSLSSCSIMTLDGTNVKSSCNGGNEFSLFTGGPVGQSAAACPLKPYRVQPLGDNSYQVTD